MQLRVTITAEQDHILRIECDVRIIDILRRDVYLMMDSVAVLNDAACITLLAQTTDRLDIKPSGIAPESCLIEITRKLPRQANHPRKTKAALGHIIERCAQFYV